LILVCTAGGSRLRYAIGDPVVVETIYALIPFSHKTELHIKFIEFLYMTADAKDADIEGGARVLRDLPYLVHHYTLAQLEDKAAALLRTMLTLNHEFVGQWAKSHITTCSPPNDGDNAAWCAAGALINPIKSSSSPSWSGGDGAAAALPGDTKGSTLARALSLLRALPWLRGLDQALRADRAGRGTIAAAMKIRNFSGSSSHMSTRSCQSDTEHENN
jgi:hypothetical protein